MRNVISILRRDLGAYFTSPIGYIFIMVFVTMSVGLYITSFFVFPVADMRPYFENLPLMLCIFIPAVTMRIWAEERKENTWEMLLTFPMRAWELTLGKFLAAMVFYMITLAATFTVPMMLFSLGSPDPGVIFGGYLGTLMMGACFLALGILFSGFFKDQIVAFVVTLLTCFVFFLLGTDFIASYLDGRISGLGSLLSDVFGVFAHYQPFIRGVIDVADVLFFVIWAGLFLALNVIFIDGRNRPGARVMFLTTLAICVIIGMLFNYLMAGTSIKRFDVTEDKIHTISPSSRAVLAEADSEIQVRLYVTPRDKMPTAMRTIERDIQDKLEELRLAAGGRLNYSTVYLEAANVIATGNDMMEEEKEKNEEEAIEQRMLDKGVKPFNVRAMSEDEVTSKLVYCSLGVGYKDKTEEIIPQIIPDTLSDLEYQLVNTIYKLTRERKPTVALVAPKEAVQIDPQMRQMLMQMGQPVPESEDPYVYLEQVLESEKYEIHRVDLTKESPLPEEYDTLVVVNPRQLNERQKWEINRALHSGKSVVMAVQNYEWDYQATQQGNRATPRPENPQANDLLEKYGLKVSEEILMDVNSVTLTVQSQSGGLLGALMGQPFNLPTHILVNNTSMNQNTSITNRLAAILYLWGTALELDEAKLKENSLTFETLMSTSEQAWTIAQTALNNTAFKKPASGTQAYPLMAMIQGQFPDAFAGQERPEWPKPQQQPGMPPEPDTDDAPEASASPVEAKAGKLVLMGCSQMFRKNFLQQANLDLFLNSVDAVTLSEHLVNVRGSKPIDRLINRPSAGQKALWQLANYGLANVIVAAIGVGFFAMRRRARNNYTVEQVRIANQNK